MSLFARQRWVTAWDRFWFAEGSSVPLALFRIVLAFALFKEVGTTMTYKGLFAIEGGFHLPYLSFILPVTEQTFLLLQRLQYPFIVLVGLGLLMRTSCIALLVLQGYVFFVDYMNFRNHPYFFLLLLLLLLLSPADRSLSVPAALRSGRGRRLIPALLGDAHPLTIQRMIQIQVCLVYFLAGLHKCTRYFLEGNVLALQMSNVASNLTDKAELLLQHDTVVRLVEWAQTPSANVGPAVITVCLELLLPIVLWSRRLRVPAMVIGTLFHLGIAFLMNIHVFSWVVIGSYFLFLDPETPSRQIRRLLRQ